MGASAQSPATSYSAPTAASPFHVTSQNHPKFPVSTTSSISATIRVKPAASIAKLQLPPLPSSSSLKPKAPAVQARAATTSALLPSTLAAKAAAAVSPNFASADVTVTPAPVYLVQAKASVKPPFSKPNAKQAPMTAPRALPPTPCHAVAAAARSVVISASGPERNRVRPSK